MLFKIVEIATISPIDSVVKVFQKTNELPMMIPFVCFLVIFAIFAMMSPPKSKLTRARWAGRAEKIALVKTAQEQLNNPKVKATCLYSGSYWKWQMWGVIPYIWTWITGNPPSLFVPFANLSLEVVGRAGSGKTFSVIDRVLASAIERGYPILLYDFKGGKNAIGGQIPFIATYAARHGYKVRIFAPGREYSCIINPLDYMKDNRDMTTAKTIAETFHANLRADAGKTDGFFGPAGKRLLYALFMLAKGTIYPDLAMAFAFMKLTNLPQRLKHLSTLNLKHFPFWVEVGFSQLIQVAEAEETSGGILAGAADLLTEFMQYDLLGSFLGNTNTSLCLQSKEILIFQNDRNRKKVISPILGGNAEMALNLNLGDQREIPLVCSWDEISTLTIPILTELPNLDRSKGYCGIYGYQTIPQLEKRYGKDGAEEMRASIGCSFWFNPGKSDKTASTFSNHLGKKEVIIRQKSTSHNGRQGVQRSYSDRSELTPLLNKDDFTSFGEGECVYINVACKNKHRADMPQHIKRIRVPLSDQIREKQCKKIWSKKMLPKIVKRETKERGNIDLEQQIKLRIALADKLLPLPPELQSSKGSNNKTVPSSNSCLF